jgi:hypothetical protein
MRMAQRLRDVANDVDGAKVENAMKTSVATIERGRQARHAADAMTAGAAGAESRAEADDYAADNQGCVDTGTSNGTSKPMPAARTGRAR